LSKIPSDLDSEPEFTDQSKPSDPSKVKEVKYIVLLDNALNIPLLESLVSNTSSGNNI